MRAIVTRVHEDPSGAVLGLFAGLFFGGIGLALLGMVVAALAGVALGEGVMPMIVFASAIPLIIGALMAVTFIAVGMVVYVFKSALQWLRGGGDRAVLYGLPAEYRETAQLLLERAGIEDVDEVRGVTWRVRVRPGSMAYLFTDEKPIKFVVCYIWVEVQDLLLVVDDRATLYYRGAVQ